MTTRKTSMPYVRLGDSGLKISKIVLGMMTYGSPEWQKWCLGEKESIENVKAAYEAGIQTFDTADVYSNGESEVILGKAIKQLNLPRDEIVVMTKVHGVVGHTHAEMYPPGGVDPSTLGYINQHGLSRKHIFDGVKNSLKRLQLDYIDLLQCHRFDPETPIAETMEALHDVVKAGYVRYIGMSSCFAWQFNAMQSYAINNHLTPFVSMQNHYSLVYREEEREMFPTLRYFGVGSLPWSPLARGKLARPLKAETARGKIDRMINIYGKVPGTDEIVDRVEELAKKKGISMAQVSIAWILSKPGVSAPIVGTSSLTNLADIIAGVFVTLTDEEIKYLEEPYHPQAIVGHS